MIYQCAMYRKLEDEYSMIQLKVGQDLPFVYGYKLFDSKGDFEVNLQDVGSSKLVILESATSLLTSAAIGLSLVSALAF